MTDSTRSLITAAAVLTSLAGLCPESLGQAYDLEFAVRPGEVIDGFTVRGVNGVWLNDGDAFVVSVSDEDRTDAVITRGRVVARVGQTYSLGSASPGVPATFVLGTFWTGSVQIVNNGDVGIVTFANEVLRFNAIDDTVDVLAEAGTVLSGGPTTTVSSATLDRIERPFRLMDDGSAVFSARFDGPGGPVWGICSTDGVIISESDTVGGFPVSRVSPSAMALNVAADGTIFFMTSPPGSDRAVITPSSVVLADGQTFLGISDLELANSDVVSANSEGVVALEVRLGGARAVVATDGRLIATAGEMIDGAVVGDPEDIWINDQGDVSFSTLENQVFGPDGLVLDAGARIDGLQVDLVQATTLRMTNDGEIYFIASFVDDLGEFIGGGLIRATPRAGQCSVDITTSGATLSGQPGFGIPDGNVDLDDLGFFLNSWLTGDIEADYTTTGATLPGQPGFGVADGNVDLDDLGYFLTQWLAGCP
ncbi:MAG: GC-type dockerin domain-anchored protein [Planctomycetota bacterium]